MQRSPFDRSMFESQAHGSTDTVFTAVVIGAFLLVAILYFVRAYLRSRSPSLADEDMGDRDLAVARRSYFGSVVSLVARRRSPSEMALSRLTEFDPPSVNCTIIQDREGEEKNEDVGRAILFHLDGELFLDKKSFFVTTPDGVKAQDRSIFTGEGEIMNLWFLHDRIPYTVNCDVVERVRFPAEMLRNMDPKIGVGYRLIARTNLAKRDKRQAIRFSHKVGQGVLRVYPQILFDAFVQKTDFRYPTEGSIPPRINVLGLVPYKKAKEEAGDVVGEKIVKEFKEAVRLNHSEDRVVFISKPFMDERTNIRHLLGLGFSEVLGLGSQEAGRTIHLKKPMKSMVVKKKRKDPHYLTEGDSLVLSYFSRSPLDGRNEYMEMVCEVVKSGIENVTVRPRRHVREETNLQIELLDFSVHGFRFESSSEFVRYMFEGENLTLEKKQERLENMGLLFTFYPKLRFTRDTEVYKPDLPAKFSIMGKIVRCEVHQDEDEGAEGRMAAFGVRFMYDPSEYSVDDFCWDRWVMIRPFKENPYFKEVHKALNGLIAHLESQSREFMEPRRSAASSPEKKEKEVAA